MIDKLRTQVLQRRKAVSTVSQPWSLAFVGLCVFTFAVVTFRLPVGELGIALGIVGLLIHREPVRIPAFLWFFLALVAWAYLASFFAPYAEQAGLEVLERLKLAIILLLAVNALRTPREIRFYLLFMVVCFLLFPARGALLNYFVVGYTRFGRAVWNYAYENSNDLAAMALLTLGASLAIAFSMEMKKYWRWFAAVSSAVFLLVLLLTQSRGGSLGLVAGFGPAAVLLVARRSKGKVYLVLGVVLVLLVTPAAVWKRLSGIGELTSTANISQADAEGSAAQRWEIQQVGWDIFTDHPIFGVGLGGYKAANAVYASGLGARDTHNTYLNVAAELGLPGLALWIAMFVSVFRSGRRIAAVAADQVWGGAVWVRRGLAGFLVAGVFGTYAYLSFPYLIAAVLWSALAVRSSGSASPKSSKTVLHS